MSLSKKIIPILGSTAAVAVLLVACASPAEDATSKWSDQKLYDEAKSEVKGGNYSRAIGYYEKLETRALGTPIAQQAQVERAYAQYKASEPAAALITLERFMRLHPASPLYDYALYLKGLINFNGESDFLGHLTDQKQSERDQKAAREAYQSYAELVNRFPNSKYAEDAKLRMLSINNSLAINELHIASYYFSRGAYLAAANRAQIAIEEFSNTTSIERALELLIKSYEALGMNGLRDDAKRVMQKNFPKNQFGK